MTFNIRNSLLYQDLANVAEIPIYNSIKLNSTNVGNLNDVQDGDLLTWNNYTKEWTYSSPIDIINSLLFVTNPIILNLDLTNFVLLNTNYSKIEFTRQRAIIGTDISFSDRNITINTLGLYQIDLDISYNIQDIDLMSNVLTILSSSSVKGESPVPFASSNVSSFHNSTGDVTLSKSSAHITYIKNFAAGSNLSVWATVFQNVPTFLITDECRLLIKRIS